MPPTGNLALELTGVRGNDLNDTARIELFANSGSARYSNRERIQRELTLTGIACSPDPLYRVTVWPTRYRPCQFFIALKEGRTVARKLIFPVQPSKVRGIQAPPYSNLSESLRRIMDRAFYAALDPIRKACLLNLAAKTSATLLGDGRSLLDHLDGLLKIAQDRLLATTHAALEEEAAHSQLFHEASGVLHQPPAGYHRTRSFKTRDAHGSLQLTFFRRGESGDVYTVDADIDEAGGIDHLFEVVRNALTRKTHPYDVREILIAAQGLDPGYSFVFTSQRRNGSSTQGGVA